MMTILSMVFVCAAFTSCSKDNDEEINGGGNNGNSSGDFTVKYGGYYNFKGENEWTLEFSNYDILGTPPFGKNDITLLNIDFEAADGSSLPVGEFSDFEVYLVKNGKIDVEDERIDGDLYFGASKEGRNGKLTISKSGDKYTVSFSSVKLVESIDGGTGKTIDNASFSFTGPLSSLPDEMFEYDDEE